MTLTVVARIEASPDHADIVKAALQALIPPTLKEEGCLNYNLYRDNSEKNLFFFYENWTSEAYLDAHLQSDHIADFNDKVGNLITSIDIRRVSELSP